MKFSAENIYYLILTSSEAVQTVLHRHSNTARYTMHKRLELLHERVTVNM